MSSYRERDENESENDSHNKFFLGDLISQESWMRIHIYLSKLINKKIFEKE
jgi:hypothetical protein